MDRARFIAVAIVALVGAAACVSVATPTAPPEPTPTASPSPTLPAAEPSLPDIDMGRLYQVLDLDEIVPIYDPVFETAGRTRLGDEQLVMGVALNGEAKAYPVAILEFREIVNDEVGGTPVLVTW